MTIRIIARDFALPPYSVTAVTSECVPDPADQVDL